MSAVSWSPVTGSYIWHCIYGHYGFDYESGHEAEVAFLTHACDGAA